MVGGPFLPGPPLHSSNLNVLSMAAIERRSPQPEPPQVLPSGGERQGSRVDGGRGRVSQEEAAEGDRGSSGGGIGVGKLIL